jgi:uncharacterized protein YjdB
MMNRLSALALLGLSLVAACDSESSTGVATTYTLEPALGALSLGQDSSTTLVVNVKRAGTDTTIKGVRLVFASEDYSVATVDGTGLVTAIGGGSTKIRVTLGTASIQVPVTVRPHPATSVELTILTGPAGGLKSVSADTGTFYALPADPLSSRL